VPRAAGPGSDHTPLTAAPGGGHSPLPRFLPHLRMMASGHTVSMEEDGVQPGSPALRASFLKPGGRVRPRSTQGGSEGPSPGEGGGVPGDPKKSGWPNIGQKRVEIRTHPPLKKKKPAALPSSKKRFTEKTRSKCRQSPHTQIMSRLAIYLDRNFNPSGVAHYPDHVYLWIKKWLKMVEWWPTFCALGGGPL